MTYNGKQFEMFGDIFNYALELINEHKRDEANNFFKAYVQYLYDENPRETVPTIDDALNFAKRNFGYFAGYYGDDVRKKVYDYFEAAHPIFGNHYNISAEAAFKAGYEMAVKRKNDTDDIKDTY